MLKNSEQMLNKGVEHRWGTTKNFLGILKVFSVETLAKTMFICHSHLKMT